MNNTFFYLRITFIVINVSIISVMSPLSQVVTSHGGGPFLLWTLVVQLVLCGSGVYSADGTMSCKLKSESPSERKVLSRLEPLLHKK